MFMTRNEIKILNDFFATLKLNALSKETRSAIIKNHLKIGKVVKETDESIEEIRKKLLDENPEAIQKLVSYRDKFHAATEEDKPEIINSIITDCQDGLRIERELTELINDLANESIDIDLIKLDRETFADECADASLDFTLSDLDRINVLFNE